MLDGLMTLKKIVGWEPITLEKFGGDHDHITLEKNYEWPYGPKK